MKFRVGDKVKINPHIKDDEFWYSRNGVRNEEIGEVVHISRAGILVVKFPSNEEWLGLKEEVELTEPRRLTLDEVCKELGYKVEIVEE